MRHGEKLVVGLALSAALVAGAQARINPGEAISNGPYHAITDRNIFGLLHKEPNDGVTNTPPTPPPNVKLIGLMKISGKVQGVFSIAETGTGKPAVNYVMGAEERQQGVDVLALDLEAKTAKVQVGENISTLKLEEPRPVTTGSTFGPAAGAAGGAFGAGRAGGPPPRPGFGAAQTSFNNASLPGAFNPNANAAGAGGDSGAIPNRELRTDPQGPQQSVEEQKYNMEVQRAAALEQGSPIANLLPITDMTPPEAINAMQGGSYQPQQPPTAPTTPTTPANNGPAWNSPQYRGTMLPGK